MQRSDAVAELSPLRPARDGPELAHDRERDLLGRLGAEIEPDRRMDPRIVAGAAADLGEEIARAARGPEHADAAGARREGGRERVAIRRAVPRLSCSSARLRPLAMSKMTPRCPPGWMRPVACSPRANGW